MTTNTLNSVKTFIELPVFYVGLLAALVTFCLFLRQAAQSWRLASRMRASARFGAPGSLALVLGVARRHPEKIWSKRRLFELVRRRVEFEIFFPKPEWRWPLRDDHDHYGESDCLKVYDDKSERIPLDTFHANIAEDRRKAIDAYGRDKAKWREQLRKAKDRNFMIEVELAGEINDNLSEIKLYFDTLKVLKVDPQDLQFLSPIKVKKGFIASQHLLTGLLVRYNAKWDGIIDGFEKDTEHVQELIGRAGMQDLALARAARDFRQIQSFIYHCWLLWGPSVPVCAHACSAWSAAYTTLQYGYGDENNAIEIVGLQDKLHAEVLGLIGRGKLEVGAMAVPASVSGRLQYSSIATLEPKDVPKALWESWHGKQDERPILFVSEEEFVNEKNPDGVEGYRTVGFIKDEEPIDRNENPARSRYYSAYFWVMFVVLREDRGEWVPLHPDGAGDVRSRELWKAAIPFFEHGNMADGASCRFSKRQLAEKALSGMAYLVDEWENSSQSRFPLRFAYSSGIDDSNCSVDLALHDLSGGETVVDMMKARLAEEVANLSSRIGRLARDGVVDFNFFHPQPPARFNHHAACTLPHDITAHYQRLDSERP